MSDFSVSASDGQMVYVGLDYAKAFVQVCVLDREGRQLGNRRCSNDWRELKESLRIIGAPITAEELGVESDIVVEALVKAREIRPDRYTVLNTANLTPEKAALLASECGVI